MTPDQLRAAVERAQADHELLRTYLDKSMDATHLNTLRTLAAMLGRGQTGLFVNEVGQHVRGVWLPLAEEDKRPPGFAGGMDPRGDVL